MSKFIAISGLLFMQTSTLAFAEYVVPPKEKTDVSISSGVGEPEPAPGGAFLTLGAGYNALTGEYLPGVCVSSKEKNQTFGAAELEGTLSRTFINAVQNMQTSVSAESSDFGFDFSYKLISIGFESGSTSSSFYNSVDSYGRLFRRIATQGESLRGEGWSDLGKTEIKNKLKRFTQICGTHYLRAVYKGHTIDQTYRFGLSSSKTASSGRDDLSFGVGKIFGFNYSDTTYSAKVDGLSSVSIDEKSRGLLPSMPATADSANGVKDLVKYARNDFRDAAVAAKPNQAVPILVELVAYGNLPATGSGSVPDWPGMVMGGISGRAGVYQSFLTVLGDLQKAKSLPPTTAANFYVDPASATTKYTQAIAAQTSYRAAVQKCVDLLNSDVENAAAATICGKDLDAALNPTIIDGFRLVPK